MPKIVVVNFIFFSIFVGKLKRKQPLLRSNLSEIDFGYTVKEETVVSKRILSPFFTGILKTIFRYFCRTNTTCYSSYKL